MTVASPLPHPADWPLVPAGRLFLRERRPPQDTDEIVTAFRDGQVTARSNRRTDGFTNAVQEIGYQGVRVGDLVVHSMDGFAGAIGVSDADGKASPVVHAYRPTEAVEARFYAYMLRTLARSGFVTSLAKGIRERSTAFDPATFATLALPVPALDEQRAIADYLDRETARLDALIAAKQRMVALLDERFQSSVSMSLLGSEPRKESGVPWLGSIPWEWPVQRVSQLFRLGRGRVMSHEDIDRNPGEYPVYSSQTADDGVMGMIGTFDFAGEYLTWTTDGANAGTVFSRTGRFSCTNVCGTLKPVRPIDLRFFRFVLNRATGWYVRQDINPKLMNGVMASIRVPVPPLTEQRRIGVLLGDLHELRLSAASAMDASVALLRERRQALITAAVTGQFPVPVAA